METYPYGTALEACNQCAAACDRCLSACLKEPDAGALAGCIALDIECSEACRFAAAALGRGGEQIGAICQLCAQACEMCAAECEKHAQHHDHCMRCAAACRQCALECRQMAEARA